MTSPASPSPTPAEATLAALWQWADAGWLHRIDAAFAQWVHAQALHTHSPQQPPQPSLPYIAALLSALQTRGHSCLPISQLSQSGGVEQLHHILGWPREPAAQAALRSLHQHLPHSHAQWLQALDSPLVERFTPGPPHQTESPSSTTAAPPLVLHVAPQNGHTIPARLYLRRYHQFEQTLARDLLARAASLATCNEARIAHVLSSLFPAAPPAGGDWQKIACALGLRRRLSIITGGPGTGKTYTAARLIAAALALAPHPAHVRIRLAAPTGKAAARLGESLQQALGSLTRPDAPTLPPAVRQALAQIPAARTLHALLGAQADTRTLRHHQGNPLALDWLLIDEASMVDLHMMASLLQALPAQAHLVLLGDKDQLDSVEAGSVLGDLCLHAAQGQYSAETARYLHATCGHTLAPHLLEPPIARAPLIAQSIAMLRHSQRFGGDIGTLAQAVLTGDEHAMAITLQRLHTHHTSADGPASSAIFWKEPASLADAARLLASAHIPSYAALIQALRNAPVWPDEPSCADPLALPTTPHSADTTDSSNTADAHTTWHARHAAWVQQVLQALARFRILCATRAGPWGVAGMNQLAIQALALAGLPVREQGWFAGRVVIVTRNDPHLGIFNGDVGIALPSAHDRRQLRIYLSTAEGDPAAIRSLAVSRVQHVETAFAMTVHKSQGSEFDHVLLCLSEHAGPLLTRELLYTGLTRARTHLSYLAPHIGTWQQAMAHRTQRASGLAALLHPHSEPETPA